MNLPIFWVDAFTDRAFRGNPAAVVPLESWPDEGLLQRIANENGLSETAFFVRTGPGRAHLRWFTPAVEVDLCGHATLATAHVLFNELGHAGDSFIFDSKSGPLSVARIGSRLELDFPARPAARAAPGAQLLRGLGREPRETLRAERMWLCVYESEADVAGLLPDFGELGEAAPGRVIVTAPGTDCDFVCRFFAPDAGIAEDPVTGSAQCTLAPYWAARLGRRQLHSRQISRRAGELWCTLAGDRVLISGHGAQYLRGQITV